MANCWINNYKAKRLEVKMMGVKKSFILLFLIFLPIVAFALTTKQLAISINLAGKQRMLSQIIAKDILLIKAGIDKKENLKKLKKHRDLFDKTLKGLMKGDKELKLKPIKNQKIQKELKIVQNIWNEFDVKILQVLNDKLLNKKQLIKIQEQNLLLLHKMDEIVKLYVLETKESVSKRAQAINLSGKMRMLTQKMAKELLLIYEDVDRDKNFKNLKNTQDSFLKILRGLQNGDKSLNLEPTKLPKIKNQLNKIAKSFKQIQLNMKSALEDKKTLKMVVNKLDTLLIEVDKVVKMYEKSIKRAKQARKLSLLVDQYMHKKNINNNIINLAGKQRMLTQKMTKLVLLISLDMQTDQNIQELKNSAKLFTKTLNGLLDGDKSLNLPKTVDADIRSFIKKVLNSWIEFDRKIQNIIKNGSVNPKDLDYIVNNNMNLLKISDKLVKLFKSKTKQTFLERARANIIDIAGRQRMLIQKMTKEKLFVLMNIDPDNSIHNLKKTVLLFDNSLKALINGDKKLKIVKPNNQQIKKELQKVFKMWQNVKPLYLKDELTLKELNQIISQNPKLVKQMNKVVALSVDVADY